MILGHSEEVFWGGWFWAFMGCFFRRCDSVFSSIVVDICKNKSTIKLCLNRLFKILKELIILGLSIAIERKNNLFYLTAI